MRVSAEWRYGLEDKYGRNMGGTARTLDFTNGKIDVGEGIISTVSLLLPNIWATLMTYRKVLA